MTDEKRPDDKPAGEPKTIDLASERRRRRKNPEGATGKIKPVLVYQTVADLINRIVTFGAPFPWRYYTFEPEAGNRLLLKESCGEVVQMVSEDTLVHEIVAYLRSEFPDNENMQLTFKQAKEAFLYWRAVTLPSPTPRPFSWPGQPGLTFRRLPWSASACMTGESTPTWNSVLSRMTNAQAFRQWVGSLFFEESDIQQYVWMHGAGNDGKGSINRFLAAVFGSSYCSKQPPVPGDRFWTYSLIGKRLVAFPDCNNHTFVASGLFKSLTGGDPIDVEAKGKMSFTIKPNCKFIFLSQERPTLSSEKADQRRIIYCEFRESAVWEPDFEEKLWHEGGRFLGRCIEEYRRANPKHGPITSDGESIGDWVETLETHHEETLDGTFRISFDAADRDAWITPVHLHRILRCLKKDQREIRGFLDWLERKHDIRKAVVRYNDRISKRYKGLISILLPETYS